MSSENPTPLPILERWRILSDTLEYIRDVSPRSKHLAGHLKSLDHLNAANLPGTVEAIGLSLSAAQSFNNSLPELTLAVKSEMAEIKPEVVRSVNLDNAELRSIDKVLGQKPPIIQILGEDEASIEAVKEFYTRVIQLARINYGHIETVTEVLDEAVNEKFSPKLAGLISQRMFQVNQSLTKNDVSFAKVIRQSVALFKQELRQALPEEWFDLPDEPDKTKEEERKMLEGSLWKFFTDETRRNELLEVWASISSEEQGFIKNDPSGYEASLIISRYTGTPPEIVREQARDFTSAVREALDY